MSIPLLRPGVGHFPHRSGSGLATATLFVKEGAYVFIIRSRPEMKRQALSRRPKRYGGSAQTKREA